jgi:integrase
VATSGRGAPTRSAGFLRHIESDRLGPLWRFLIATGTRRGEALGLRWCDVDLDAGAVTIRWSRVVASDRVVEGAPKTKAGQRTIAIDADTAAVLRSWKSTQAAERLLMGARWGNDVGVVFTQPDGTPLYPQTITLDTYSHVLRAHDQAADFIGRSLETASQTGPQDSVTNL